MNRTRLLLVVLVLIIIVVAVGAFVVTQTDILGGDGGNPVVNTGGGSNDTPTPFPTIAPTATEIPTVRIVRAVQDIPRGVEIQPNMVDVIEFPEQYAPLRAFSNIEEIVGRIARTDIFREDFILANQIVDELGSLAAVGSDAAAILDPNRVAVSLPIDQITSVAYAVRPGDRVDVIVSMLFVDIDPDFQSITPTQFSLVNITESVSPLGEEFGTVINLAIGAGGEGEFDTRRIAGGGVGSFAGQTLVWPVLFSPSEPQRPRLATQRTVQDAEVVWVGQFPLDGILFRPAPTPTPVVTPDPEASPTPAPEIPPTNTPAAPQIITLAVRPQDAVVLTYMAEAQLPLTFALRSARSQGLPPTDPVTLDYILNTFNIVVPERLNYGIQPAITSIRSLSLGDRIDLNN